MKNVVGLAEKQQSACREEEQMVYYRSRKGLLFYTDVLKGLKRLKNQSVQCCVTSPPYWRLRDYKSEGQLGLEKTPEQYVENLVKVFREVWRVLKDDGTVWLNLGGHLRYTCAEREKRRAVWQKRENRVR